MYGDWNGDVVTGSHFIHRIIAHATSIIVLTMLYIHMLSSHSSLIVNQLTDVILMDPSVVSTPCLLDSTCLEIRSY